MKPPRIPKQQGFVLILTLCILAAITIVAGYFGLRMQQSLQLAQMRQTLNDKQIAISNTRAEILFRLCTTHLSQYGLGVPKGEIALDDRPYANEGTTVQLQDARGLIAINYIDDTQLYNFLGVMQVPVDQRHHLIDTLHDYTDADDLRRLEGAESAEYAAAGLPPPRNMPLVSPFELKSIIGWRDMPSLWQDPSVTEFVSVGAIAPINPNTAPWQVLAALPGVTPALAKAVVARRKLGPIDVALFEQLTGTNQSTFPPQAVAYPSDGVRITQRAIGMPWAIRYNLRLTPLSSISPWQIGYYYRIEDKSDPASANNVANSSEIPQLPARSVVSAAPSVLPFQ
ncbi:MAG: type II secretion system protein GspK [Burkholderiaceae bacterium]|nr:type II secretion system protein GspK [Burkholderiaceae bacterium]